MDELLGFFEQNNVSDFSQDQEIKQLLAHLKDKIEVMKKEENWKEKEADRMRHAK